MVSEATREAERLLSEARDRKRLRCSFIDFAASIGVELTRAQRVIGLVAFDNVDPIDLPIEYRPLAVRLFGPIDRIPPEARRVVVAVTGARGGKSYVLSAVRGLHLALTVPLLSLAPGQVASLPIIAPDKDLAREVLNYVRGALKRAPAHIIRDKIEFIDVERSDGAVIEIVCRAASAKGRTGRGRSLVGAILDEAAFFGDADYRVSDEEIFKAVTARVEPGGQIIIPSTPWTQNGLLFDLFASNHPDPSCAGIDAPPKNEGTALAIHASTLIMNPRPSVRAIVDAERKRDPDNAKREYDAQFMGAAISSFFDAFAIEKAIDETIELPLLPPAGATVSCGGDLGFRRNASALAIVHRDGPAHVTRTQFRTADLIEMRPGREALKPSIVMRDFAAALKSQGATFLMADGHYRETAVEHLDAAGLQFVDAPTDVSIPFVRVRLLLHEGRVKIPRHDRLIRQLRGVMGRALSGGRLQIQLPRWKTGEHGDLVAAWVLAVYQAAGDELAEPDAARFSDEWLDAQEAVEAAKGPWWAQNRPPFRG